MVAEQTKQETLKIEKSRFESCDVCRRAWYQYFHLIRADLREFLRIARQPQQETVYLLTRGPEPWMGTTPRGRVCEYNDTGVETEQVREAA